MPPPRMTANPVRPARYRPGKAPGDEPSSSSEEEDEADDEAVESKPVAIKRSAEPTKISSGLRDVSLADRHAKAKAQEAARLEAEKVAREQIEAEFETEESSAGESSEDEEGDEESSEEESSSEDDAPKLLRPTFVRKDQRKAASAPEQAQQDEAKAAEDERRRKEKANDLLQEQLEKQAAARAAGKKDWDDDQEGDADMIDDTDGRDPEAEYAAWKLRELKRVKREREKIEDAEREREEVERRRNLTEAERKAEDDVYLAQQREEREDRAKVSYLQKYHHKGAFFQDDLKEQGLDKRDLMGARFADQVDRSVLPEYMQIRDMTKLGKKGRTRYKDLKSEDTGRWGDFGRGPKRDMDVDERFQPDRESGGRGQDGPTGANATQVRERRRSPGGQKDTSQKNRSPRRSHGDADGEQSRRRSDSVSRSRSPPRRHSRDRKRSPSPHSRHEGDKRRRVDV